MGDAQSAALTLRGPATRCKRFRNMAIALCRAGGQALWNDRHKHENPVLLPVRGVGQMPARGPLEPDKRVDFEQEHSVLPQRRIRRGNSVW